MSKMLAISIFALVITGSVAKAQNVPADILPPVEALVNADVSDVATSKTS